MPLEVPVIRAVCFVAAIAYALLAAGALHALDEDNRCRQ